MPTWLPCKIGRVREGGRAVEMALGGRSELEPVSSERPVPTNLARPANVHLRPSLP